MTASNDTTITIPLTRSYCATISQPDIELIQYKWHVRPHGNTQYAQRNSVHADGKRFHITLHRAVLERMLNRQLAKGEYVDHIDGNGLNNCRNNLRVASKSENKANSAKPKNNTSGYKGVYWLKNNKKWAAHIKVDGIEIYLGLFATVEEGHEAYKAAAIKYYGEFARFE